ncbi:MAG: hypothetical protein IJD95_06230 [Clostridia bacterium]|nr:hypothetical protein [Clostridia bacterium]MBR2327725.1 hypothetical protein [Clostridia bacterium]
MADNRYFTGNAKESVCINSSRIYDCCKDKDCFEDVRVYLTRVGQSVADRAINIKARSAEVIWVYIDVEEVPFNDGFYTVDLKFFFRVTFDAFCGVGRPTQIEGLAVADKKVILYGSNGNARIFSSLATPGEYDFQYPEKTNLPKAVVEAVDPLALATKVIDPCDNCCCCECDVAALPAFICNCFDDELVDSCEKNKLLVTLGLFSMVRLEREVQMLIPAYDFCVPCKECPGTDKEPCELFKRLKFPTEEFFPPLKNKALFTDGSGAGCGCNNGCNKQR